jgi:hypothetical protein
MTALGHEPRLDEDGFRGDGLVDIDGEQFYRVTGVDRMPPFLMSVVSDGDRWMFVSSGGALTAGRGDASCALFPYVTDDRLHASAGAVAVTRSCSRSITPSSVSPSPIGGDRRSTSASCGPPPSPTTAPVRCGSTCSTGSSISSPPVSIPLLYARYGNLTHAYKRSELIDTSTGLAVYSLEAPVSDRAEPAEVLRATVAWSSGFEGRVTLDAGAVAAFDGASEVEPVHLLTGVPGAYLLRGGLELDAGTSATWHIPSRQRVPAVHLLRRHGDPSRPWNRFSIRVRRRRPPIVYYEGNWRDIFQNWEALLRELPRVPPRVVSKFERLDRRRAQPLPDLRDGIDWEVPDPDDPWSNIGYWGDHQIVYLLRLLEAPTASSRAPRAGSDSAVQLRRRAVPDRRPYDRLLTGPEATITFDSSHRGGRRRAPTHRRRRSPGRRRTARCPGDPRREAARPGAGEAVEPRAGRRHLDEHPAARVERRQQRARRLRPVDGHALPPPSLIRFDPRRDGRRRRASSRDARGSGRRAPPGVLSASEQADLLDALFASELYRADQRSFMLAPARRPPSFLDKNVIPEGALRAQSTADRPRQRRATARWSDVDADGSSTGSRRISRTEAR